MTRQEIENALDNGNLWAAMANGRYWKLRRNGATQTWKRDASRFSIPAKAGLKAYTRLTETDNYGDTFIISETDPNKR